MRKVGVKNLIVIVLVVLSTLVFSILSFYVSNLINSKKEVNNQQKLAVVAWTGAGTSSSPYLIQSKSDLKTLSDLIYDGQPFYNIYFKLTTDLDYKGESFSPIGSKIEYGVFKGYSNFGGHFDGNGHTISNISVSTSSCSFEKEQDVGLKGWGEREIWDYHQVPHIGLFAYVGSYDNYYWSDNETINGWNWTRGKYTCGNFSDIKSTIKNVQVLNFTVSNSVSGAFIGGIAGRVDTNYSDTTGTEYDHSMAVEISACAVQNFNISNCGRTSYVGGIVGAYETITTNYLYTKKININNCVVMDFYCSSGWTILTVLTPSYSVIVFSGDRKSYLTGNDYCVFAYAYDLSDSITNNTTYYTINAYLGNYDAYNVYEELANDSPISYYTGDYYELEVADGGVGYDQYVLGWNELWYCPEYQSWGYLEQFVVEMSISVNNSSYGSITCTNEYWEYTIEDLKELGELNLPKGVLAVSGNNLNIWNLYTAKPTANAGYKFKEWQISSTGAVAIFETDIVLVEISFKGNDNTSETSTTITLGTKYKIKQGSSLNIKFDDYNKGSGYSHTCTLSFTDSSGVSRSIIYSTKSNEQFYISKSTLGRSNIAINANTYNIGVETVKKTYTPSFV